jgi:hypothetical protein
MNTFHKMSRPVAEKILLRKLLTPNVAMTGPEWGIFRALPIALWTC